MSDNSSLEEENVFSLSNFLFWLKLLSGGIKINYLCLIVLEFLFEIDVDKHSD